MALSRPAREHSSELRTLKGCKVTLPTWTAFEFMVLAFALAAALLVRPWRLLQGAEPTRDLSTPLLALLVLLPWLWAWPGSAEMPIPLRWSGAALAVLMLGWPLAVPVLTMAGLSTMATVDASLATALSNTVWLGVLPATVVLGLGSAVRRMFGTHPVAYLFGRAFAVPLLALVACTLTGSLASDSFAGADDEALVVTAVLMAMAEATWTCAVASTLVAWRPQWLATWSDALYLKTRGTPRRT
jgi:uncharacterized membrane protein